MNDNRLRRFAIGMSIVWIIVQIVMIAYFFNTEQRSDQGAYMAIARDCFENGEWYPMQKHVYSSYIWAPGLINYFILQLKIFGTLKLNMVFNLLMNVGILYEVYYLARRFFSVQTAYISVIVFCLLYSNYFVVLPAGTEIPFLFLSLTAFCLCLNTGRKVGLLVLAGVLFAVANWIRPLVIIFVPVAVLYMIVNRYRWQHYVSLLLPIVCIISIIGISTKNKIGYFNYQSTTSGVNLIMTANDAAYGGVAVYVVDDTTNIAYIKDAEKLTFVERDSIWRSRAVQWIKENPVRYAKLYCMKLGGLYIEDSWPDRPILGGDGFVGQAASGNTSDSALYKRIFYMFSRSLVYYIIGICFLYALIVRRKEIFTPKGWVLLVLLLGTLSTCLLAVSPRYHYPFLFAIIIWGAYGIETFFDRKRKKS